METRLPDPANRPKQQTSHTPPPTRTEQPVQQPLITAGRLGAIALVLLSGGGIAGCGWLGVQLMVNPQSLSWINRIQPGWIPTSSLQTPSQTLHDIRAELRRAGTTPGEFIPLSQSTSLRDNQSLANDWLLPIYLPSAQNPAEDAAIVELRVYQSAPNAPLDGETSYQRVTQLAIAGLAESFVVAPLVDAHSTSQGSSRPLTLTHLSRYEGTVPAEGIWLDLSGHRDWGSDTPAYGQILYYNPKRQHLSIKLQWTSPVGEEPIWKKITGNRNPELIVNQTVGLEPDFEIYQLKPLNFVPSPVQLQPISVADPAIDQLTYHNALLLARGRLWSTSLKWLESLKSELSPNQWTGAAQAQLELVKWHARITATQADSSWASPSQQVLSNLIDGRWERALTVFEASDEASREMMGLLKNDSGRLEHRMKSALQVGTENGALTTWMGLLIAAQRGNPAAIAWFKKQPKTRSIEVSAFSTQLQRLSE